MTSSNLLSKADVASFLSISRRQVDRMLATGRLTRVRIGSLTRIPADDVAALVKAGREADRHAR